MIKVDIRSNVKRVSEIVDENMTIRQAMETYGFDYTSGMTSLDGVTLPAGGLDKTFADYGVVDHCYIMNVVKADNAAAVKVVGSACVIESAAKLADIKLLEKFRPNALALFEGTGSEKQKVFAVGTTKGNGSINAYGASFGTATTADGKATITIAVPEGTTNAKEWAADHIGVSILKLKKVEEQFAAAIEEVAQEQAAVKEAITVA